MTNDVVIRTEGLGKRYKLGALEPYRTLRDAVAGVFRREAREKAGPDYHWALRDIDIEVRQGEVLGIVGRNGSGKSTLLKLLTRITRPTEGRITVQGRIGALLEVGTGFHPELTGRENIYLNGSVLGMSRADIARRFDEIVDFSGVEEYLDTPVKRYSSGMNVRLAFAVAAHLEPEILVIDEVLAVGDAAFQRKCLGRMGEVAAEGRTVLFVSHQMEMMMSLCERAIWLDDGALMESGTPQDIVSRYMDATRTILARKNIESRPDRILNGPTRLLDIRFESENGRTVESIPSGNILRLVAPFENKSLSPLHSATLNIAVRNNMDRLILFLSSDQGTKPFKDLPAQGNIICELPRISLVPGIYTIDYSLRTNKDVSDKLMRAASFEVLPGDFHRTGKIVKAARDSAVFHEQKWNLNSGPAFHFISTATREENDNAGDLSSTPATGTIRHDC